jgi:hypothetical protein
VRLSFGPLATDAFIDEACARIRRCGQALRRPALTASNLSGAQQGLQQLSCEGRHGWILFDHESHACIAIDPPAGMAMRIAAQMQDSGLGALAVLGTGADPAGGDARAVLRAALGFDSADAGTLGWPRDSAAVTLADGRTVPAIAIGTEVLARVAGQDGRGAIYLLGRAPDGRLAAKAVRLAFIGGIAMADAQGRELARLIDGGTVLCHGLDIGGAPCTTMEAACGPAARADTQATARARGRAAGRRARSR